MQTDYALTPPVFTQKFLGKVVYELGVLIGSPEKAVDQVSFKDYDEKGKKKRWGGILAVVSRPDSENKARVVMEVKEDADLYLQITCPEFTLEATLPIPIQAEIRNPNNSRVGFPTDKAFLETPLRTAKSILQAVNQHDGCEWLVTRFLGMVPLTHFGLFKVTRKEQVA